MFLPITFFFRGYYCISFCSRGQENGKSLFTQPVEVYLEKHKPTKKRFDKRINGQTHFEVYEPKLFSASNSRNRSINTSTYLLPLSPIHLPVWPPTRRLVEDNGFAHGWLQLDTITLPHLHTNTLIAHTSHFPPIHKNSHAKLCVFCVTHIFDRRKATRKQARMNF